jgi:hypothetical protein
METSVGVSVRVTCRGCGEIKTKRWLGKNRPEGRGRIYHDETGRKWKGGNCPSCSSSNRGIGKLLFTKRKCQFCKKKLPQTHYFTCADCIATREGWSEDHAEWGVTNGFEQGCRRL